jgi:hypothetical protein
LIKSEPSGAESMPRLIQVFFCKIIQNLPIFLFQFILITLFNLLTYNLYNFLTIALI